MARQSVTDVVSNIHLSLEGMMILFVNEKATTCRVGILKYAPQHDSEVNFFRITGGQRKKFKKIKGSDFQFRMWLDVQKPEKKIVLFHGHTADKSDFDLVLDFEGRNMYPAGIAVSPDGFKSILSINDGTFFTAKPSGGSLVLKKKNCDQNVGKVAIRVGCDISLAKDDLADFWNGTTKISLPVAKDTDYEIEVKQARPAGHMPKPNESDAENFYTAVAGNIAPSDRIHFDQGPDKNDPDSRCMTPTASQSNFS